MLSLFLPSVPPPTTLSLFLPSIPPPDRSAHARVVWGVHWSPDDSLVASGSRDGAVKLWAVKAAGQRGQGGPESNDGAVLEERPAKSLPTFQSAVCSLAFAPLAKVDGGGRRRYMLAIGLEDGNLQIWYSDPNDPPAGAASWGLAWGTCDFTRHSASVSSLCWRVDAATEDGTGSCFQVATAGRDHSVRVFAVRL